MVKSLIKAAAVSMLVLVMLAVGLGAGLKYGIEKAAEYAECALGGGLFNPAQIIFKAGEFVVDQVDSGGGKSGETFTLDDEQKQVAATIIGIGRSRRLDDRDITIALMTGWQESTLHNLDHGDRDSLGIFQQRPSQGWGTPEQIMTPVYAINTFYDHLVGVKDRDKMTLTQAAQSVQNSGAPDAYAKWEGRSKAILKAAQTTTKGEIAVVGDSLTVGVDPYQTDDLKNIGWATVTVDGQGSRRTDVNATAGTLTPRTSVDGPNEVTDKPLISGVSAVQELKAKGIDPKTWVIALGTNDLSQIHQPGDADALIESMLNALGSDKEVLWINVYVPGNQTATDLFNQALTLKASSTPNLAVGDWAAMVAANPGWLAGDGVHYNDAGYKQRSQFTAQATARLETTINDPSQAANGGSSGLDTLSSVLGSIGDFFSPCNLGKTIVGTALKAATGQLGYPWKLATLAGQVQAGVSFIGWAYGSASGLLDSGDPDVTVVQKATPVASPGQAQPGDIIYWGTDPTTDPALAGRRGLYLGDGQVIVEPKPDEVVAVTQVNWVGVTQILRPNPDAVLPAAGGWEKPLHDGYVISSPYGMRTDPVDKKYQLHDGVDMAAPPGTKVYAAHAGTVKDVTQSADDGKATRIDVGDGVIFQYIHFESIDPAVQPGAAIKVGQVLGVIGDCGCRRSTGTHLHFQVHTNAGPDNPYGDPTDPMAFMSGKGVDLSKGTP